MLRPKYPLDPVEKLRKARVDEAIGALAKKIRGREEAEVRQRVVAAAHVRAEAEAEEVRDGERAALLRGELMVADLARGEAWEHVERAARLERENEAARAAERESALRGDEERARDELESRKADADVVARDRAGWKERETKRELAKEEESQAEAWRKR